ncbi:MAG: histidinol phosphatase [Verrucomicrobiales bacterium]|nr:histidinol phosphatase [Verrucomicrobiales bacterium]|tara:strand:- start:9247 stop:10092 length:846 start_codon:yes stop_codon:yes gene_type:complete
MKFADLHMHTNFSDGTFTPEELAQRAHDCGLRVVALTDHDTLEGCERMGKACENLGIEYIVATELTAEYDGYEIHLLGYYLDLQDEYFLSKLCQFQKVRQSRIIEMAEALNKAGVPLEADAVFELAKCKSPGRPHVARAMVNAGLVKSMDVAFEKYLKKGKPAWVPKFKISAFEAIELVHRAGGVAVMAHPGLNRTDEVLKPLIESGMDGIECFHTRHSTNDCERYECMAEEFGVLITGGSDCHGMNKGRPLIGGIKLPYVYVERMKERVARRRGEMAEAK